MRQLTSRWKIRLRSQRVKILLITMLVAVVACTDTNTQVSTTGSVEGSTVGTASAVVTLGLGRTGGFADEQIEHLIASVAEASDGRLRIELADEWDVTGTVQDVESMIVEAVASGELDLGWVGARAFTTMGVTDFDALTAPMVIDSYPLQRAVLDSDIPVRMLAGVEALGVRGLAVMGGGMRVPSGVNEPFLGVDTYSGRTFHAYRSQVGAETLAALGAIHTDVVPEARDTGLSDGSIEGYENTIAFHARRPALARHVTANVALWPGVGVLVVSPDTLTRLDDQQQSWLRSAAVDTSANSVDLISDDSEALQEVCDLGGSVYEASESEIASLREALRPVYDQLMNDSGTAKFIAEIDEIKESIRTEPVAIPEGCAGGAQPETRACPTVPTPRKSSQPKTLSPHFVQEG